VPSTVVDDEATGPHKVFGRWNPWLMLVVAVTMLAGLLFGYDQGVISGALTFIKTDFDLSNTMVEVVTSWVTLGALFGALVAGIMADRYGRRASLITAGALFIAGALTQSLAPGVTILVIGRFVVGFGVGVASVAAPLYASELAPAERRGRYVSSYQLAITMGILVAYMVDALLSSSGDWRLMLGIAVVPGALLVGVVLVSPPSPRWLLKEGRRDDARRTIAKVQGAHDVDDAVDRLAAEIEEESTNRASWGEVFASKGRKALWVGLGLALFQQITGINAIIYYADQIFDLSGLTSPTAQADATMMCVGAVNVLATFIAVAFVDKLGRRPLLFAGLTGMTISLAIVGLAFHFVDTGDQQRGMSVLGMVTMMGLMVYIASFAFSLGPIVWTIINEIYPNRIRGRAVGIATAVNWGAAFVVSQTFLTMVDDLGTSATFMVFAGTSIAALIWVWRKVPETKGISLERMPQVWAGGDPVRAAARLQAENDLEAARTYVAEHSSDFD
jgi:sugar porter (SP) family MFS transporter